MQFLWTWALTLFSLLWRTFTIICAYNCSLPNPFSTVVLSPSSEDTLLVLKILSHGTLLLLGALTSQAFKTVRWAEPVFSKSKLSNRFDLRIWSKNYHYFINLKKKVISYNKVIRKCSMRYNLHHSQIISLNIYKLIWKILTVWDEVWAVWQFDFENTDIVIGL